MMNKINCTAEKLINSGRLQSILISNKPANEPVIAYEESITLLPGGSIDYGYYDNRARVIRSTATHVSIKSLLRIFKLRK